MKRMLALCLLAALLGLATGTAFSAEKWTKPQQEVADVFKAWADSDLAGDVEREMSLMAPAMTAWDFAKPAPMDRAAFRQLTVDIFKQWKVTACAIEPTFIHIEGRTAVAHGRYTETMKDASGAKTTVGGPWTASLVRQANKWLVLGLGWIDDPPKLDEAAARQEVSRAVQDYFAVCEHLDLAAQLGFHADVPEFRFADIDGKLYDHAEFRKLMTDLFAGLSALKVTARSQEILVLGPDTALVIVHGALDMTQKDASAFRWDDYIGTFLFQRLGGAWKIVFQEESGLPPQPIAPAPGITPTGAPTSPQAPNLATVREFFATIDRNDFGKLKELSADDFSFMAPGLAKPLKLEDLFQVVKKHYASFPDWTHHIKDMMAEGDKVAVRLLETGTHKADYEGIPATNAKVTMPALAVFVVANGKVRELWAVEDYWDFYQQLGMELKPKT